jgi:CheY-like chemotaxis protein
LRNILWVDDEVETLSSHILFLKKKGYDVTTATSGEEALQILSKDTFEAILLDEMMVGLSGLDTLKQIRQLTKTTPVIMITKTDEEDIMDEGIAMDLDDYLIKPVNPKQIIAALKRLLDSSKLKRDHLSRSFGKYYNSIIRQMHEELFWQDWVELYYQICDWDIQLQNISHTDTADMISLQVELHSDCNKRFSDYYEKNYREWINSNSNAPIFSHTILENSLLPLLEDYNKVFFILIDGMRLDHWLFFEDLFEKSYRIEKDFFFSIIPTTTVYSRNAIFSGLTPLQQFIEYSDRWSERTIDSESLNRYEPNYINELLRRNNMDSIKTRYYKIFNVDEEKKFMNNLPSIGGEGLTMIVYNFLDTLTHEWRRQQIIEEMFPGMSEFRKIIKSWVEGSSLMRLINQISNNKDTAVVITSDHGSIMTQRGTMTYGDKEALKSLRFWVGRNLRVEDEDATLMIKKPEDYQLPEDYLGKNYVVAKEDYNLVFAFDFHKQLRKFKGSFQHGGISLEEVIVPFCILLPK